MAAQTRMILVLAALAPLAAADITPAALLPRQSVDPSGEICDVGQASQSVYYECYNIYETMCVTQTLSASAGASCFCDSQASVFSCYNAYCNKDDWWTAYSTDYTSACQDESITPGPFTFQPGQVQPTTTTAAAGTGGGQSAPQTASSSPQTTSKSASKNAGAVSAPLGIGAESLVLTGFVAAWIIGYAGLLLV